MKLRGLIFLIISGFMAFLYGCEKDPPLPVSIEKETPIKTPIIIPQGTTPYDFNMAQYGNNFPPFITPTDNPTTVEGVELGRHLFYEKLLSKDNSISCASCHQQKSSFVDGNKQFSEGVGGVLGFRNSMPLFNLSWMEDGLFWDGKAQTLEELIAFPITRRFEMHEDFYAAMKELAATEKYPKMFKAAFDSEEINTDLTAKAIAQFLRTLIAYPKNFNTTLLTPQEKRGLNVFLAEDKGDCFHCHDNSNPMFTSEDFVNNGSVKDVEKDPGLFAQTGIPSDQGKFKVPGLINLAYTAPYFHDGRFKTLEEVLDFYDTGFHVQLYLDKTLVDKHVDPVDQTSPIPRAWSEQDKKDLIAYLLSLEDTSILTNPAFSDPNE